MTQEKATATESNATFESLLAHVAKWKRRALAFQEGYKDKSFEVTALEIQLMDGVDKVTTRINESLKTKMLAACIERNEVHAERDALLSEVAQLKSALQKILDNDNECGCEHDNENCCELNQVFCPRCIAARALLGKVTGDGK